MKKSIVAIAALAALTMNLSVWAADTATPPATPAKTEMKKAVKPVKKVHASTRIKALQEALNKHGAKLKVDGIMGRKTRMALHTFQKKNGLKATGRLDKTTEKKLGLIK